MVESHLAQTGKIWKIIHSDYTKPLTAQMHLLNYATVIKESFFLMRNGGKKKNPTTLNVYRVHSVPENANSYHTHSSACDHTEAVCFGQTQCPAPSENYQQGSSSTHSVRSQRCTKSHNASHQFHRHSHPWSHSFAMERNTCHFHKAGSPKDRTLTIKKKKKKKYNSDANVLKCKVACFF